MIYSTEKFVEGEVVFESADMSVMLEDGEKRQLIPVPNDRIVAFPDAVVRLMDAIETATEKKVGEGVADAFFGKLKIKLGNAKERVKKHPKNHYAIIIPLKGLNDGSINVSKIIESVLSKEGFKKGGKMAGMFTGYFYKKGTDGIYACGYYSVNNQIQIQLVCVENSKSNMEFIKMDHTKATNESTSISSEGCDLGHCPEEVKPNDKGFEGITIEDLYGTSKNLGLTRSEDLSKSSYSDFFRDPKIMSAFTEHFDLMDNKTRKVIMNLNEADQSSVLTALTSKLYDNIVKRVDDIDYGDIPGTKGDITKLPSYEKLSECIALLRDILKEYRQNDSNIEEIALAIANMSSRKDMFEKAFRYNCELPMITYNNMVLAIISSVSYMISTCIEFIKTPNSDSFQISLDKVALAKTKNHLLYNNLKKFNNSCAKGDFDKAMMHVIDNRIDGMVKRESSIIGSISRNPYNESFAVPLIAAGVVLLCIFIIPILRELTFFFYYARMRVSEFFDVQADLLQMNAYNLSMSDTRDNEEKEKTVNKQLKIVEFFRKIANKISFTSKSAEVNTTKEITSTNKKMKIDDVVDDIPDSAASALF